MSYYTVTLPKFKDFLDVIKRAKPPEKATQKWLASLGFKSVNHRPFLKILQQIKFLDSSSQPTELYHDFRDSQKAGFAMAKGLKQGYFLLWDRYEEPYKKSEKNLVDIFIANEMSEDTAKRAENTFRLMLDYADFDSLEKGATTPTPPTPTPLTPTPTPALPTGQPVVSITQDQMNALIQQKRELGVNINIQVTLPETTDAEVYEQIFAALKKHFFSE